MTSGKSGDDGPPPADDEGRSLLFGWSKGGEEPGKGGENPPQPPGSGSSAAAPATVPAGEDVGGSADPWDLAGALASLEANQQRILALLADLTSTLVSDGEGRSDLAEAARTIAGATEWSNNIKAAMDAHLATVGRLLEGLKGERGDLAKVVAELKGREEGLKQQQETLDKGIQELRDLWKLVNERTLKIETAKKELAHYYKAWCSGAATMQENMIALSTLLRSSHARMQESVNNNVEAQLEISTRTLRNVRDFKKQNDGFLDRFDEGGKELLGAIRREWTDTRRWTVPALAVALVFSVPSTALVGAIGQSEFGIFARHNETQGWRREFLERYGDRLKACASEALNTKSVVRCSFDVTWQ